MSVFHTENTLSFQALVIMLGNTAGITKNGLHTLVFVNRVQTEFWAHGIDKFDAVYRLLVGKQKDEKSLCLNKLAL